MTKMFPVIDLVATGENSARLRKARGLSVRDVQNWFGFEEPQAIYKWQKGQSLPTVDNLYALGALLEVPMEEILVSRQPTPITTGQQVSPAARVFMKRAPRCPDGRYGSFWYTNRVATDKKRLLPGLFCGNI